MKRVLYPEEIANADRYTIEVLGMPGIELMARAGRACIEILEKELKTEDTILIVAGTGNNGGDAFVMAETLLGQNYSVQVIVYGVEANLKLDARHFFTRYKDKGGDFTFTKDQLQIPEYTSWVIDGLLGTGLKGPVRGTLRQWIQSVNSSPAKVFSVDIPSGNYPGGNVEHCIHADLTVTFQALKPAHVISPGCFTCGKISIADIGIQTEEAFKPQILALEADDCQISSRMTISHKGTFGTLAVLGGARGMEGAAALTGLAALRMGAGKVRIYSENQDSPKFSRPALMVDSWKGDLARENYQTWVIGPGLSKRASINHMIEKLPLESIPTLWDADGLAFLKHHLNRLKPGSWVMTPHPGEAAELLKTTSSIIQSDRLTALQELGTVYPGGWIILKGARSMVLSPGGTVYISIPGNPALAVAGSGDVLSGIIGGLLAQGLSTEHSTLTGLLRHGLTGEHWVQQYTDFSMLPEDMLNDLKNPVKSQPSTMPTIIIKKGNQTSND